MRLRSVATVFAFLLAATAAARPEGSAAVRLDCASAILGVEEFDGRIVEIEGEVVGLPMARGSHAWINIAGAGKALGLWAPLEIVPEGLSRGSWKGTGDILLVRGMLNRACEEHGGELDVHVASIEIVAKGAATTRPLEPLRLAAAVVLVLAAAALFPVWLAREREARRRAGGDGRDTIRRRKERKGI